MRLSNLTGEDEGGIIGRHPRREGYARAAVFAPRPRRGQHGQCSRVAGRASAHAPASLRVSILSGCAPFFPLPNSDGLTHQAICGGREADSERTA